MASKRLQYHFKKGQKEIYLPDFVLTLIRSPFLPATYAKFLVPLDFTKLDIRDYLFHAYNIRVLRVRSFVEQQKVTVNAKNQKSRKRAIKKMTVEMDKPFVWPEMPESFSDWDKETFDAAQEHQEKQAYQQSATPVEKARRKPQDRESIAKQAKALLTGKDKWRPSWEALGKEVAYEQKEWTNNEVLDGEESKR